MLILVVAQNKEVSSSWCCCLSLEQVSLGHSSYLLCETPITSLLRILWVISHAFSQYSSSCFRLRRGTNLALNNRIGEMQYADERGLNRDLKLRFLRVWSTAVLTWAGPGLVRRAGEPVVFTV